MANKRLKRLTSLPADFAERLGKKGIKTCKDFLSANALELMDILDVTYCCLQKIQLLVCGGCVPKCMSALEMYKSRPCHGNGFLSTTVEKLDVLLKGGLPPKTITEISGAPGSGKTQFCLTLCVAAALSRISMERNHSILYIDTEGAFSAERLVEIATSQLQLRQSSASSRGASHGLDGSIQEASLDVARRVFVYSEMTCDSFLERLSSLERIIPSSGVGVVIVDSVASLVRKEYDVSWGRGIMDRTEFLLNISAKLKCLAEDFNLQVVVTNQIYATPSPDVREEFEGVGLSGVGVVTPALGNAWYHSVNTRLVLEYCGEGGSTRKLSVDKSPVCAREDVLVKIGPEGFTMNANRCDNTTEREPYSSQMLSTRDFPFEFPGHWQ